MKLHRCTIPIGDETGPKTTCRQLAGMTTYFYGVQFRVCMEHGRLLKQMEKERCQRESLHDQLAFSENKSAVGPTAGIINGHMIIAEESCHYPTSSSISHPLESVPLAG